MGVKRIHELDYIRCIAMFMVVMGHVLLFSLKIEHTALLGIIGICEMPLFFIVSGYLTYKERRKLKRNYVAAFETFKNFTRTFSSLVSCAKYSR